MNQHELTSNMAQHASDEVLRGNTFEYDSNACVVHRGRLIKLFAKEAPSGTSIDLFADIDDRHRRVLLEAPSSSFVPSSVNIGAEERSREQIDHVVATLAFQLLQQRMEIDALKRENHLLRQSEQPSEEEQDAEELAHSGEEHNVALANHAKYIRLRSSLPKIDPFTDAVLDEPLFVAHTRSPLQASDSALPGPNLVQSTSSEIENLVSTLKHSSMSASEADHGSPISSATLYFALPPSSQLHNGIETSSSIQHVSSTESGNSVQQSQETIGLFEASSSSTASELAFVAQPPSNDEQQLRGPTNSEPDPQSDQTEAIESTVLRTPISSPSTDFISASTPSLSVESSSSKEFDGIMSKEDFQKWFDGSVEETPLETLLEAVVDAATDGYLPIIQYMQVRLGLDWKNDNTTVIGMINAASMCGSLPILRYVRSQGVDLKREYDGDWHPVECAIQFGQLEVLRWLKEEIGMDLLPAVDSDLTYPLDSACNGGYLSVLKYLVAIGGDLKWKDADGSNLAHAAARGAKSCCHLTAEKKAKKQVSTLDPPNSGEKKAHVRLEVWRDVKAPKRTSNAFEVLQWLHEKGVDVCAKRDDGVTTAHLAAGGGHLPMLQWLHSKGVDLLSRATDGASIAHFAAKDLHLEVLEWLVDTLKLDLNSIRTLDGSTVAHFAGHCPYADDERFLKMVKYLHSKGVDLKVKRRTATAQTVLSLAPLHLETFQWLHSVVGVNVKTACVQTSSRRLCEKGHCATILTEAAQRGYVEILQWLDSIDALKPSVMSTKVGSFSPIEYAAYHGRLEILKWLHSRGYDVVGLNTKPPPPDRKFLLSQSIKIPVSHLPPPFLAAVELNLDTLDWYIDEMGMDINAIDPKTGASFVGIAVFRGLTELFSWLRGRNVNISAVPRLDFSLPIARRKVEFVPTVVLAASTGNHAVLEYLHNLGDKFLEDSALRDQLMDIAASLNYKKVLQWIASKGYDISHKGPSTRKKSQSKHQNPEKPSSSSTKPK